MAWRCCVTPVCFLLRCVGCDLPPMPPRRAGGARPSTACFHLPRGSGARADSRQAPIAMAERHARLPVRRPARRAGKPKNLRKAMTMTTHQLSMSNGTIELGETTLCYTFSLSSVATAHATIPAQPSHYCLRELLRVDKDPRPSSSSTHADASPFFQDDEERYSSHKLARVGIG